MHYQQARDDKHTKQSSARTLLGITNIRKIKLKNKKIIKCKKSDELHYAYKYIKQDGYHMGKKILLSFGSKPLQGSDVAQLRSQTHPRLRPNLWEMVAARGIVWNKF